MQQSLSIINSHFILHIYICFFFNHLEISNRRAKKKNVFFQPPVKIQPCVPIQSCKFFAGLCCCTCVAFNQGLIFEAMPVLYMASSNENKQKIKRWVWEGMSNVKTYTLVLGKVIFVQTVSKAKTISYRRECVLFPKNVLSTAMSSIKSQSFASEPRSKQSFTSARASQIPYSATSRNWNIPLDCAQGTCAYPFYESNMSMKRQNQFQLYVVWMHLAEATSWGRTVQKSWKSSFTIPNEPWKKPWLV